MITCTSYYHLSLNEENTHDIDICILGSYIYSRNNELIIAIPTQIEPFESVLRAAEIGRPQYLILLGILSFITDKAFTVFDSQKTYHQVDDLSLKTFKQEFIYNGEDYSNQLMNILDSIENMDEHSREVIFSALDRWRKARYMEQQSENNSLYNDELYISFFHVIELLAESYGQDLNNECELLTEKYIRNIFGALFISDTDKFKLNKKLIKEIMFSPLTVTSKIKKMLFKLNLKTEKISGLISSLVKDRNNVAHGVSAFQNKVIYPLPPFFPLVKNKENFQFILVKTLSARVIDKYLGSNIWEEKWKHLHKNLPPSSTKIKAKLKTISEQVTNTTSKEISGLINPEILYYYILQRKITFQEVEVFFTRFTDIDLDSKLALRLVPILIILLESKKEKVSLKAKKIIIELISLDEISKSEIRDLMYEIDYFIDKPKIQEIKQILTNM